MTDQDRNKLIEENRHATTGNGYFWAMSHKKYPKKESSYLQDQGTLAVLTVNVLDLELQYTQCKRHGSVFKTRSICRLTLEKCTLNSPVTGENVLGRF